MMELHELYLDSIYATIIAVTAMLCVTQIIVAKITASAMRSFK